MPSCRSLFRAVAASALVCAFVGSTASAAAVHEPHLRASAAHAPSRRLLGANGFPTYLVRFKAGADTLNYVDTVLLPQLEARVSNSTGEFIAAIRRSIRGGVFNGVSIELSPEAYNYLATLSCVELIVEDTLLHFTQSASPQPSIAFNGERQANAPWQLDRIDERSPFSFDSTYSYTLTGAGVDIYVMDSGINTEHVEFTGRVEAGANFATGEGALTDVEDCAGHGTHVAGIAAGTTYGVAKEATVIPVRVYGCDNSGPVSDVVAGMNYVLTTKAARRRPAVVNMSFGGTRNLALNDAAQQLIDAGAIVVVAAGNEAENACGSSPASLADAITVAASTSQDSFASFSNYGSCVDLIAPGEGVESAYIGGPTAVETLSGTSMATPVVSGVVALFLQRNPEANAARVSEMLACSSTADAISNLPTSTTPNLLAYSPPTGFQAGQVCAGNAAAALFTPLLALMFAAALLWRQL